MTPSKLILAKIRATAAVVVYVECPTTGRLIVRPAGSKLPPHLVIDVN